MRFLENITIAGIIGIVLLIAGALVTFLSAKISANMQGKHANLIVKCIGLAAVAAGFVLIMFL